jgi:LysM repeat protein
MVVPPVISPETRARLFQEMQQVGLDPNEYTVGEGMSINPITGMPEFGFLKKVFKSVKKVAKKVAPIALPLVIPGVGGALSGALGGIGGAIGTGIKTLIPGSAGIVNAIGNVGSSILGGAEGIRKGIGSFASGMFGGPMNTPGINPAANYTIQPGDTLSEIAARAGTTVDALAKANNIANPNMIFAGQNLTIPTNPMTSGIGNFVRNIFGSGQNQNQGIFGGGAVNNLANLAIIKKILDQPTGRDPAELIPMGQSAFGYTPQQIANIPSYRIGNLTPALIEGQEYANVKPVAKAEAGGIMGLKAGGKIDPNRMDDDGPGDITPAFLEPGEFVMTRPATRVLGARNLYKLMKEAEQMA